MQTRSDNAWQRELWYQTESFLKVLAPSTQSLKKTSRLGSKPTTVLVQAAKAFNGAGEASMKHLLAALSHPTRDCHGCLCRKFQSVALATQGIAWPADRQRYRQAAIHTGSGTDRQ